MKVTAFLRQKKAAKNNVTDQSTVFFRVRDGIIDMKAASELSINPNHWDRERQAYKSRVALVSEEKRKRFNKQVRELSDLIAEKYYRGAGTEWLKNLIAEYYHPAIFKVGGVAIDTKLTAQITLYLSRHSLSKATHYTYHGIIRKIERYERYQRRVRHRKAFSLFVDQITENDLYDLRGYIANERNLVGECPWLFEGVKPWCLPRPEFSENALYDIFHRIRTIVRWAERQGIPTQKPFRRFEMGQPLYGTPYYLTLEERDRIYDLDLTGKPKRLQCHRDLFMFQCMVGCRMGDIPRLTRDNIKDGILEYMPHKTKDSSAITVRVPLGGKARAIMEKYKDRRGSLLPYFVDSQYNDGIRELCRMAGIDRRVSVLDPKTRTEAQRPLCDVASSHMARRTFIGNLYKQVKDPNLIASMSGHVEGSRAFSRYRTIDDEMKRELIDLIS